MAKWAAKLFSHKPEHLDEVKGHAGLLVGCGMITHHLQVKSECGGVVYTVNNLCPDHVGAKNESGGIHDNSHG